MKMGRILQQIALLLLPLGVFLELSGNLGDLFGVNHLVYMLAFGVILFCIGRYIEGFGG